MAATVLSGPAPAAPQKPATITTSCSNAECHVAQLQHKVLHGPAAQDKCLACHTPDDPARHTFKYAREPGQLCVDCHMMKHRDVVHQPVKQLQCTGCHDPHGSEFAMLLVADPARGLCTTCHHQDGFASKKHKHGPVEAGACVLCHEAHSSWQPHLLVAPPGELCQRCHVEVLRDDDGPLRHIHKPAAENCSLCHDAHASDYPFQLLKESPDLCFGCHADVQEQVAKSAHVHGAMNQAGGCRSCHAPHGSALPKLQRVGQMQMCLTCHDKEMKASDGRTLTNMKSLLATNENHHAPINEGGCSLCHLPHAGDRQNMLVKAYPAEFYAPFSVERYELCFTCHRAELVQDKQGVGLTRFRNGEVNLHWLHVNREKGRTCRACHEVHASKHAFHIRDAVPFGQSNWMLEIRFAQTATGGSCAPGCHGERVYDHGPPPEAPPPPEAAKAPAAVQP